MKITTLFGIALLMTFTTSWKANAQQNLAPDPASWGTIFSDHRINGTFVLHSLQKNQYYTWNKKRATTRYLPASTFKIPNTLIGLQTKAVRNIEEIFEWNGTDYGYDAWNCNLSLREAFRLSAVWVYQEIARRVGQKVMDSLLKQCEYGNMLTGPYIDRFWLEGDIAVSAVEQIGFLKKLYFKQLPFDTINQQMVREIMRIESTDNRILFAKTGWAARIQNQIGWYVGFIETPDDCWIFALNIDIKRPEDLDARISVSRQILHKEGIYPYH